MADSARDIALRVGCVFIVAIIFYSAFVPKSYDFKQEQPKFKFDYRPLVRTDEVDGSDFQTDVSTKRIPFPRDSLGRTNRVVRRKPNVTSLSPAVYKMAKPVFDKLPDEYLPGYKSSCWKVEGARQNTIRCLPYFYIVGMPKCGTSDLWMKIVHHPQVVSYRVVKEPHWWTRRRYDGIPFERYLERSREMVTRILQNQSLKGELMIGDGSASTMWDNRKWRALFGDLYEGPPHVMADVIRAVQPEARLIAILRDPVSRLYSDYLFFNRHTSPEEFHHCIVTAVSLFRNCTTYASARACVYDGQLSWRKQIHVRLLLGIYVVYIRDWLRVFPQHQLMILRLDDWHVNCTNLLPDIFEFLQLERLSSRRVQEICASKPRNSNKKKVEAVGPMFPKTERILRDFYANWNRELSQLLDNNLYMWQ
ncbi:carbohydrate sulfotransferase 15-like [Diadema antillarum]|uniref:carbohydrate sulfotransferase 15-like n=1 Tax=Diadema antillarum TaxID=105358 RepID=UPI003A8A10BB